MRGRWDIADVRDGYGPADFVNLLINLHHDQTILIDVRRNVQTDADRQLLIRISIAAVAAVGAASDVRHRAADEDRTWGRVGRDDFRILHDIDARIGSGGLN